MLALKLVSGVSISAERVSEAVRYLEDRRCSGGGWNVGNPFMFDACLPARAHQSAWVMLALAQFAPDKILPEDIRALRSEMHGDGGALTLACGLLALRTIGQEDHLAERSLISMQEKNGGWANDPHKTAVALMAMQGHI
jgi:hypothetical protein